MKKLLYIILTLLILTSCGGEEGSLNEGIEVSNQENNQEQITKELLDKTGEEDRGENKEIVTLEFEPIANFSGSFDDVIFSHNLDTTGTGSNLGSGEIKYTSKSNVSGSGGSNEVSEKDLKKSQEKSKMMLILDVSGSMAGIIDGKAKIQTAREVVKKVTKDYDKTTQIGFMAYGHNRKGDCGDIATLVEPNLNNASEIASIVDGLIPKGMTPMGASVLMAAEQMKFSEEKTSIVLVTDGKETCDINICELGKRLEKEGIDFTAHVISFGVDKKDTDDMKCLAESTGGQFLMADNATSLGKALDSAVSSTSCVDSEKTQITLYFPEKVIAGSDTLIKWRLEEGRDYDKIMFYQGGEEPKTFEYIYPSLTKIKKGQTQYKNTIKVPELPGKYKIVYKDTCGDNLLEKDVEVIDAKVEIFAPNTMVAGSDQKIKWNRSTNAQFDKIAFYKSGDEPKTLNYIYPSSTKLKKGETKFRTTISVPEIPGEYQLIYQTYKEKNILIKKNIKIIAPEITIMAPKKAENSSEMIIKWNRNTNSRFDKIVFYKGGEEPKTFNYIYPSSTKIKKGESSLQAKIKTPSEPGEYELIYETYKEKNILFRQKITIY